MPHSCQITQYGAIALENAPIPKMRHFAAAIVHTRIYSRPCGRQYAANLGFFTAVG